MFGQKIQLLLIFLISMLQIQWLNPLREKVEQANQIYFQEQYEEAVRAYTDIAANYAPESDELHYNIGNAWFKQADYDKAIAEYQQAIDSSDETLAARAHYSIGNAHFKKEDYASAIDSYIKSLDLNPDDEDAKYNLEVARRKLKEQIDQNKDQQQNQQEQQQDQQQQQSEQNEDQQDQNQQNQQNEHQQDQEQQPAEQNQQEEGTTASATEPAGTVSIPASGAG